MNPSGEVGKAPFQQGTRPSAGTLNSLHKAVFRARGTNGINVRWESGVLVVEGVAQTGTFPFRVRDVSVAGSGWFVTVDDGYFSTTNESPQSNHLALLADDQISFAECYLYLHAEFDTDEELTGTPELLVMESTDPVLTTDLFTNGYLQIAKIEQVGTVAAPSLTITQYVGSNVLHRKINLTHLWEYNLP